MSSVQPNLSGRSGLLLGLSDAQGMAWRLACEAREQGARLVLACPDNAALARMAPQARRLEAPLLVCDVRQPGAVQGLVQSAAALLDGSLDFAVHALPWAPLGDGRGRVTGQSAERYLEALQRSCHSFAELAHWCQPHMAPGGTLITLGDPMADAAVRLHGLAGPVQAALSSMLRYLADDLAPQGIRVQALPHCGWKPLALMMRDQVAV